MPGKKKAAKSIKNWAPGVKVVNVKNSINENGQRLQSRCARIESEILIELRRLEAQSPRMWAVGWQDLSLSASTSAYGSASAFPSASTPAADADAVAVASENRKSMLPKICVT